VERAVLEHPAVAPTVVLVVLFLCMVAVLPAAILFPYTTLFRSQLVHVRSLWAAGADGRGLRADAAGAGGLRRERPGQRAAADSRSEEHTSELQSRFDLVCRLLLEKKKSARQAHGRDRVSFHPAA